MMRSLWSAASGMIAQQTSVDTISNNLANVNTVGFKAEKAEFKSLLYQTIQSPTTTANGENKPINAQVGLGTRTAAITSQYAQGALTASESNTAFAINGQGFFSIQGSDGKTYYTRNGNFQIAVGTNGMMLTDSSGNPVLDSKGNTIVFPKNADVNTLTVSSSGEIFYQVNGKMTSTGKYLGVYQFGNAAGLEKLSNSLLAETEASGQPINERTNNNVTDSQICQNYLEASSVQVVDEMVNLIVAQRAYEMNSKAIQAADDMLSQANQLKR